MKNIFEMSNVFKINFIIGQCIFRMRDLWQSIFLATSLYEAITPLLGESTKNGAGNI